MTRIGTPITICFSAIQNRIESTKKAQCLKLFPSNVQKVNIADLQDHNGKQPSYRWFNGQGQKAKEVYAITSFGIFLLAMRQRNPREEWLKSGAYQSINMLVNTVCLEQFSGDNSEATTSNHEPSPKRIRMERQICLLQEKNKQDKVILSVRAQKCMNKIENVFQPVEFPSQISTPAHQQAL